jgi:hypothetical protein
MKDKVNKIRCSTGCSEEAMRRKKNKTLDFIGFAGTESLFPRRIYQLSLLFPKNFPDCREQRHIFNVPRRRGYIFVLSAVKESIP